MYPTANKFRKPVEGGIDHTDANAMPAEDPDETCKPPGDAPMQGDPDIPTGMTLENIIDLTGEFEHLNELVMLQLKKEGGFACPESYFSAVHPILDLLEVEIRLRCHTGMGKQEMKLLIQDWIDEEISLLKSGRKR